MSSGNLVILAGGISSRMKNPNSDAGKLDLELLRDAENKSKSMIGLGKNYRPFLDYLLYNAREAGYSDIVLVIGRGDNFIKDCYGSKEKDNEFKGLNISYAIQLVPEGRTKPLGTADALLCALKSREEWKGKSFTVCNSDNLYSQKALSIMLNTKYLNALIDYDRRGLKFTSCRITKFAVTKKDDKGFLLDIIEKPSQKEIDSVRGRDGFIGVSMNIFKFNYSAIFPYLEKVPLHPIRNEKEIPSAVMLMLNEHPKTLSAHPLNEHVPDLTNKEDILPVKKFLEKAYPDFHF